MPTTCSKLSGGVRLNPWTSARAQGDISASERKNVSELKLYLHFNNYYVPIHLDDGAQFPFLLQAVPTANFPLPPLGMHRRYLQLKYRKL